ncbi:MAG: hypothetical protein NW203_01195 [Hyphomonadaceae bacterium]|nr:hypothetical protein [Hyphomonadaceae bacterium]
MTTRSAQIPARSAASAPHADPPVVAPPPLHNAIVAYLRAHHSAAHAFWTEPGCAQVAPLQDLCDALYVLRLLPDDRIAPDANARFADALSRFNLAGRAGPAGAPRLSVHATAYALGALTLLRTLDGASFPDHLHPRHWSFDALVSPTTHTPRWPRRWSQHSWRVSHWIGGAPSILLALREAFADAYTSSGGPDVAAVLHAADALLDRGSGFLHPYRSDALHAAFNFAYGLRHNPIAAELGGVVHLHWVNYACRRMPFVAAPALHAACAKLLIGRRPFIEHTPYCLDFDIVHLLRTSAPHPTTPSGPLRDRIALMQQDLQRFFETSLDATYTLHRLPGALAALHECALLLNAPAVSGLAMAPRDIILTAYWL